MLEAAHNEGYDQLQLLFHVVALLLGDEILFEGHEDER